MGYDGDGVTDVLENWEGQPTFLPPDGGFQPNFQNLALSFARTNFDQNSTAPEVEFVDELVQRGRQAQFRKAADVDGDGNMDLFGLVDGRSIGDYIDNFYNVERRHSHLDYLNPIEFELRSQVRGRVA